jgi:hypothetical protein
MPPDKKGAYNILSTFDGTHAIVAQISGILSGLRPVA